MGDWSPLLKYRHSGWNNISKTSRTSRSQFRIQSRHPGNNSKIIINPTVCKNNYRAISLLEVLIVTRLLPGYYLLLHTSTRTTIYYAASSCQTVCLCAWIQFILAQSNRVCVLKYEHGVRVFVAGLNWCANWRDIVPGRGRIYWFYGKTATRP